MMTACDLSAITKPWEIQSKVSRHLGRPPSWGGWPAGAVLTRVGFPRVQVETADTKPLAGPWDAL